MSFDPNMTYWQSLKIVARGLIQWPTDAWEIEQLIAGLKDVLYYGLGPIIRITMLLTLPISAPIFAWIVQVNRRKTAAAREKAKAELRARIHRNGP